MKTERSDEGLSRESLPPEAGVQDAAGSDERSMNYWLLLLPLIAMLVPLILCASPASSDYFMHLSRVGIFSRQNLPLFHDAYHFKLVPIPNLGFDLVVPLFSSFMAVATAGKAFTALAFLLQATGAMALVIAVQKRLTPAALILPMLVYNLAFSWGFMGYLLGVGIALWGVATYLLLEQRGLWMRVAVLAAFSIGAYFCHLEAFALMVVTIVLFEVVGLVQDPQHRWGPRLRGAGVVSAACAIPAYIHLFVSPIGQSAGTLMQTPGQWSGDVNSLLNPYRSPSLSIIHDVVLWGTLLLIVTGNLKVDRRLGWVALGLFLVYMATPFVLYGSSFANTRILGYFVFVFFAALKPAPTRPMVSRLVMAGALALIALQAAFIVKLWSAWNDDRAQMLASAAKAPPGTMFVSIEQPPAEDGAPSGIGKKILSRLIKDEKSWQPPTNHVTDEVALIGEYLPIQMYNTPGKQPVELDGKYMDLYFRINSCDEKSLWRLSLDQFRAMPPDQQKKAYLEMPFNPIHVYPDTKDQVGDLLALADRDYRAIRKTTAVYPYAGTYVVYVHHDGPTPNPLPELLKPVSEGRLYSVYEVIAKAAARRSLRPEDAPQEIKIRS